MLSLVNKRSTVYDISAFTFIESPKDGPFYEERRTLMQKGLGNVTSLLTACEKDWEDGQRRVQETCEAMYEIVQRSFTEMWHRGNDQYQEVKKDLGELHSRLERLVLDKDFQLSPEELAICDSVQTGPVFRVLLGDCRLATVEALFTNLNVLSWDIKRESQKDWAVKLQEFASSEAEKGRTDVAMEAAESASQLGADRLDFSAKDAKQRKDMAKRLQFFFPSTARPEAEECLKAGEAASKAGHYDKAVEELKRGRKLVRGAVNSKLYLQLSNVLAENYFLARRYEDSTSMCKHLMNNWTVKTNRIEIERTVSCYFAWMMFSTMMSAFIPNLKFEPPFDSSPENDKLLEELLSDSFLYQIFKKEATSELIEKALQFDQSISFITITYISRLVLIYVQEGRLEEAEKQILVAIELISCHYPNSPFECLLLVQLILVYAKMERTTEAAVLKEKLDKNELLKDLIRRYDRPVERVHLFRNPDSFMRPEGSRK